MSDLLTLSCPSCAGLLEVSEGNTNTVCLNCDTPILLEGVVNRYIVKSSIDSTVAVRVVRRKLEELSAGVLAGCRVRKPFLAYVPFWMLSCRVDGYVFGVKPVFSARKVRSVNASADGSSQNNIIIRTVKQRKGVRAEEHQISSGCNFIVSAAHLEPLGIPSLGAQSQMGLYGMALGRTGSRLPIKIFDSENLPESAHVVDPSVSINQAKDEFEEYIQRICGGVGVGLEQRSMYLAVTGSREKLVHYPLWVVEYVFNEKAYRIVVDGYSGKVLRGAFPSDSSHWRKVCRILGSVWAGLIPILMLIENSDYLGIGPVYMFALFSIFSLAAASAGFLRMAEKNAGMDSLI
ncbi:MAG: hypothetical protein K8S62_06215 [Candidatus Sabulitectum sp.]|nr:hypothetical protein [Candidatus Sabulitectum sp.]